ncbi:riboflavin synthase subunit alpha [Segnochrobactraceae bacterium EtOH-i3]
MFTGIVQAVLPLARVDFHPGYRSFTLNFPEELRAELKIGASVALDGTCLTVVAIDGAAVRFDAVDGTLEITNLADRVAGDRVNVERSFRPGDENGGHVVSGHVTGTAEITALDTTGARKFVSFRIPEDYRKYIFDKGFLALNGASLTVAAISGDGIHTINLIPETIRQTSLSDYAVGDRLNFEVEAQTRVLVDTMERVMTRFLPKA